MKDTLIEIKNNLQGNSSRVDEAENQLNDLEDKKVKNNWSEEQREKRIQKNEGSPDQRGSVGWPSSKKQRVWFISWTGHMLGLQA